MSSFWHWFIIIITGASLAFFLWLLLVNRTSDGGTTGHSWDGIEELDNPLPGWWVGMFILSIVFTVIYLVIYPGLGNFTGAVGWSSQAQHDADLRAHEVRFAPLYERLAALTPDGLIADRDAMQVGRRLFLNNCATCHGVNGGGTPGFPNLRDPYWIWGGEFSDIEHSINAGRHGLMPAWGPALGNDGVTNVANYALALANLPHDAAAAEAGAPQYQVFCVSCHGVEGKGNPQLGAPDITSGAWIYGTELDDIARTIRVGREGVMPAFGEIIDADQRKILAAYVKSLSQ